MKAKKQSALSNRQTQSAWNQLTVVPAKAGLSIPLPFPLPLTGLLIPQVIVKCIEQACGGWGDRPGVQEESWWPVLSSLGWHSTRARPRWGARGKGAWSFTFRKMFAFAMNDQKNHSDGLNFQGPGRSGGQKLCYAYIFPQNACLINQLKFVHLYF